MFLTLLSCWVIVLSVCWHRKQSTNVTSLWVSGVIPICSISRMPTSPWVTNRIHKIFLPSMKYFYLFEYETLMPGNMVSMCWIDASSSSSSSSTRNLDLRNVDISVYKCMPLHFCPSRRTQKQCFFHVLPPKQGFLIYLISSATFVKSIDRLTNQWWIP